jgi:hypothetical protein
MIDPKYGQESTIFFFLFERPGYKEKSTETINNMEKEIDYPTVFFRSQSGTFRIVNGDKVSEIQVWNEKDSTEEKARKVAVHIERLRQSLGDSETELKSVQSVTDDCADPEDDDVAACELYKRWRVLVFLHDRVLEEILLALSTMRLEEKQKSCSTSLDESITNESKRQEICQLDPECIYETVAQEFGYLKSWARALWNLVRRKQQDRGKCLSRNFLKNALETGTHESKATLLALAKRAHLENKRVLNSNKFTTAEKIELQSLNATFAPMLAELGKDAEKYRIWGLIRKKIYDVNEDLDACKKDVNCLKRKQLEAELKRLASQEDQFMTTSQGLWRKFRRNWKKFGIGFVILLLLFLVSLFLGLPSVVTAALPSVSMPAITTTKLWDLVTLGNLVKVFCSPSTIGPLVTSAVSSIIGGWGEGEVAMFASGWITSSIVGKLFNGTGYISKWFQKMSSLPAMYVCRILQSGARAWETSGSTTTPSSKKVKSLENGILFVEEPPRNITSTVTDRSKPVGNPIPPELLRRST